MNKIVNNFPAFCVGIVTDKIVDFVVDHGFGVHARRRVHLNIDAQLQSDKGWGEFTYRMERSIWKNAKSCLSILLGMDEHSLETYDRSIQVIVAPYPSNPSSLPIVRVHIQATVLPPTEYTSITRRIAGLQFLDVNNAMHYLAAFDFNMDEAYKIVDTLSLSDFISNGIIHEPPVLESTYTEN